MALVTITRCVAGGTVTADQFDACVRKVYVTDPETGYLRTRPHFAALVDGQCPTPAEHAWSDAWEHDPLR